MGPLGFYNVKWFFRQLLPAYLEWWNGFKWILEWCGVRKCVGCIGQPYFLRLYHTTDTFFFCYIASASTWNNWNIGILSQSIFSCFTQNYCVAYFLFSDCIFRIKVVHKNSWKKCGLIIACRVVKTGTVAGFIWLWLPVVIVSSRKYFLLTVGLICAVSFKKKRNFKLVCMVFGV